jgi:hypothetical protein
VNTFKRILLGLPDLIITLTVVWVGSVFALQIFFKIELSERGGSSFSGDEVGVEWGGGEESW